MLNNFFNIPTERIQLKYVPEQLGEKREVELPFKLLMIGNYKGYEQEMPINDRSSVSIDKKNFDNIMLESNVKLELNIKNHLCSANEINQQPTLGVELKINNLRDFHPDALTKQVPELDMLLKFRTLLKKVKSQPAQVNTTIKEIQQLLADTQKMNQPK